MTEHAAAAEPTPPAPEHAPHGHTPEEIRKEMWVYIKVLIGLAVLTGVTVVACYKFDLPVHTAIVVALIIASIKGFLVAGFFMHLLSERKVIFGVLILTLFFFAVLLWGPTHNNYDMFGR